MTPIPAPELLTQCLGSLILTGLESFRTMPGSDERARVRQRILATGVFVAGLCEAGGS
jgi:hypothetical protein